LKALIIGSGAREHALAWKFARSKSISGLFITPGNAGTAYLGSNQTEIDPMDFDSVIRLCVEQSIDVVFVGPEDPLAAGIVDRLTDEDIPVIGPPKRSALLESSKVFSKRFMTAHGIPSAASQEYTSFQDFKTAIEKMQGRIVIKKNGLAAGKGVLESENGEELLAFGKKILDHDSLLIEEFLSGYEVSVFILLDGENYMLLPVSADFKKAGEEDSGPNTGGMGAVCPVPWVDGKLESRIENQIVIPTVNALKEEGLMYQGVLYFGLMVTDAGPKVLEFNVRLGDPEAQVLLPVITSDFGDLTEAIIRRTLNTFPKRLGSQSAVGVVIASKGYPYAYKKGVPVSPIPSFAEEEILIFHAATRMNKNKQILTGGGRCFTVVGLGSDILSAANRAYNTVDSVRFDGAWYRTDIGKKFYPKQTV